MSPKKIKLTEDQMGDGINGFSPKSTSIKLCHTSSCCPTVEIHHNSGKVIITDDDGGKVTLTKKQWRIAVVKVGVDV